MQPAMTIHGTIMPLGQTFIEIGIKSHGQQHVIYRHTVGRTREIDAAVLALHRGDNPLIFQTIDNFCRERMRNEQYLGQPGNGHESPFRFSGEIGAYAQGIIVFSFDQAVHNIIHRGITILIRYNIGK